MELFGLGKLLMVHFQRTVVTLLQFRQARRVNVEAQCRVALAEFDGEWQANITEPDNGDLSVLHKA